ncbi:hypothetical protein DZB91_09470 [Brevibacillus sp. VP]|nr:hypothetical protein DZB91_09470 [Brevibacillus sp. VP]
MSLRIIVGSVVLSSITYFGISLYLMGVTIARDVLISVTTGVFTGWVITAYYRKKDRKQKISIFVIWLTEVFIEA